MSEDIMTIRQMCDLYGVTARTLRFYEDKDLLAPIRQGQKRLYTKRERVRLRLILRGKRFGFTLEEIRRLLDLYNEDSLQFEQLKGAYDIAKKRLSGLKDEREAMDRAIVDLEGQLRWGRRMLSKLQATDKNNDDYPEIFHAIACE